jgi:hypothetical protein
MTACPRITKPTDLRAPGAIDQLIAFHRQTFGGWNMGPEEDAAAEAAATAAAEQAASEAAAAAAEAAARDAGFPANTPVAEMTAEQQAAYHLHQSRKHEERNKDWQRTLGGKTPAEVAAELEELRTKTRTEGENAIEEAKRSTKAEVTAQFGERLVAAEFKAAFAHLDETRREQIISGLNLTSYITESGDVDTAKVTSYAAAIAPADTGAGGQQHDFGGGRGGGSHQPGGDVDDYKAQMEKSLGRRSTSTQS